MGIEEIRAIKLGIKPVKEKYKVPKQSKKRKKENPIYSKMKKQLLNESDECQAKLKGCSRLATDVHHKQKSSPNNRIQKDNFLMVCRSCHNQLEALPVNGKENISRFQPTTNEVT